MTQSVFAAIKCCLCVSKLWKALDPSLSRNGCLSRDNFTVDRKAFLMCGIMSTDVSPAETWNTFQNRRIDSSCTKRCTWIQLYICMQACQLNPLLIFPNVMCRYRPIYFNKTDFYFSISVPPLWALRNVSVMEILMLQHFDIQLWSVAVRGQKSQSVSKSVSDVLIRLLFRIREIPGSNVGPETGNTE
jgi:hypothetical protein